MNSSITTNATTNKINHLRSKETWPRRSDFSVLHRARHYAAFFLLAATRQRALQNLAVDRFGVNSDPHCSHVTGSGSDRIG